MATYQKEIKEDLGARENILQSRRDYSGGSNTVKRVLSSNYDEKSKESTNWDDKSKVSTNWEDKSKQSTTWEREVKI